MVGIAGLGWRNRLSTRSCKRLNVDSDCSPLLSRSAWTKWPIPETAATSSKGIAPWLQAIDCCCSASHSHSPHSVLHSCTMIKLASTRIGNVGEAHNGQRCTLLRMPAVPPGSTVRTRFAEWRSFTGKSEPCMAHAALLSVCSPRLSSKRHDCQDLPAQADEASRPATSRRPNHECRWRCSTTRPRSSCGVCGRTRAASQSAVLH